VQGAHPVSGDLTPTEVLTYMVREVISPKEREFHQNELFDAISRFKSGAYPGIGGSHAH